MDAVGVSVPGPGRPAGGRVIFLLLLVTSVPLALAYIAVPAYFILEACPADTFARGLLGDGALLVVGGLALFLVSFDVLVLCLAGRFMPPAAANRYMLARAIHRHSRPTVVLLLCGLALSIAICFRQSGAVYCAMPESILVRRSTVAPWQVLAWQDVILVQAYCKQSRHGRYGGVWLDFRDGDAIQVGLSARPPRETYVKLRAALAQASYTYQRSYTVGPMLCPDDLYPLLLQW